MYSRAAHNRASDTELITTGVPALGLGVGAGDDCAVAEPPCV
jgi:hypothetical protein